MKKKVAKRTKSSKKSTKKYSRRKYNPEIIEFTPEIVQSWIDMFGDNFRSRKGMLNIEAAITAMTKFYNRKTLSNEQFTMIYMIMIKNLHKSGRKKIPTSEIEVELPGQYLRRIWNE